MVQLQPQYRSEIVRLNKTLQMNSEYSHCKYWHSAFKKDPKQRLLAHSIAQMDTVSTTRGGIVLYRRYEPAQPRGLLSITRDWGVWPVTGQAGVQPTFPDMQKYIGVQYSVHCTVHCTVAELAWWHCTEAYHCTIITAITRHLSHQKTINSFLKGWDQHWNVLHCEKLWGFRETSTLVFHCAA